MKLFFLLGIFFTANFVYAMPVKFRINNSKSSKGYERTSLGAQVDITEKTSIDG